jgi:hypothetical protein
MSFADWVSPALAAAHAALGEAARYHSLTHGPIAVVVVPVAGDPVIPGLPTSHVHRGGAFEILVSALPLSGDIEDVADTDGLTDVDRVGARLRPAKGDTLIVGGVVYRVESARFADPQRLLWRLDCAQG